MEVLSTNSQLESTVNPVEMELEIPEVGESDPTAKVEPQIVPSIVEEPPARFEEDRPVLAVPEVRQLITSHLYLLIVNP